MLRNRLILAQSFAAILALGCSNSHARDDAGHRPDAAPPDDGGGLVDARVPDADVSDAGTVLDAGFDGGAPDPCEGQDAREAECPEVACFGPPSWHWDGDRCFPISCGTCEGGDCASSFPNEEACRSAFSECTAELCRSTDGDWQWWAEECGHFRCGFPAPADCLIGGPVCDCGDRAEFVEGVGCVAIDGCPEVDPLAPEELCPATGGSWSPICCDSECGDYCPLPCAQHACDCGPMRVFDAIRGCILATRCFERGPGDSCGAGARCEEGTICCDGCGDGGDCPGAPPRCVVPVCDGDPSTDACGHALVEP